MTETHPGPLPSVREILFLQILVACLVFVAVAAPTPEQLRPVVQLLRDERQHDDNGNFRYLIETDNGIFMEATGSQGPLGQTNIQGSYR